MVEGSFYIDALMQEWYCRSISTHSHAKELPMRDQLQLRKIRSLTDELTEFCESLTPKQYVKGEIIYQADNLTDTIYFIKQGTVKLTYADMSGRKITLNVFRQGDVFGETALIGEKRRTLTAQALQKSQVYAINSQRILNLIEKKPLFGFELIALFCQRTRELECKLEDIVFQQVPTRLSRQLVQLAREHGKETEEGTEINFKLTHSELADMIGCARENTTTALNRLSREGIIDKHRYRIIVKDHERLEEKAYA